MKILIVSVFFPPQNASASQRPYSWAKHWARLGHEVTVITPTKDLNRSDLTPMPFDGFRVIEVPLSAPAVMVKEFLKKVLGRGSGPTSTGQESGAVPAKQSVGARSVAIGFNGLRARCLGNLRLKGLFSSTRMPDPFDMWIPAAVRALPREDWDLIVSTYAPYAAHLVGWRAKARNPRVQWICDFRDLWTCNHVYGGIWPFTWLEYKLEKFILRRCDFATTVSAPLAESLRRDHPSLRVEVVPNGIDLDDLKNLPRENAFLADEGGEAPLRRILYTGSLHPVQRNARPLLEALARLDSSLRRRIEVIFVGPNSDIIAPDSSRLGLGDVVTTLGSVARTRALQMQRDADVLLFLEFQHDQSRDGVLTGKLFEYLASGRPVWAVGVGSESAVGRLVCEMQWGQVFGNDVEAIHGALEKLAREGADAVNPGAKLQEFDRGALARRMLALASTSS
jgi:glycosyltransferase involved in cell wall biosynthesis